VQVEVCHNIICPKPKEPDRSLEYNEEEAAVIAMFMTELHQKIEVGGVSFVQQYLLHEGLKRFGKKGHEAALKEMDQLDKRSVFTPISIKDMTPEEKAKAMNGIMFLAEKHDKRIKGQFVYNGKPSRAWHDREDTASPTVSTESLFITAAIDAHENRDVMTCNLPNAFCQTDMPVDYERVIMKITGVLVDILVQMNPTTYKSFVVYEHGKRVIYVRVLKAIYGQLVAALLLYQKIRKELESIGFKFNPYDPCVANRKVHGSQHTVRFHVDDMMSSHRHKKVNDEFLKWLNKHYGNYGEVTATRGKVHKYLGITFDFSRKGKVDIDMSDYIGKMVDDFSEKITDTADTPAAEDLFAVGESEKIPKKKANEFHTVVAKGLFVCKRARPDIQTTISVLCSRVKEPNEDDWKKLVRLLKYLNGTRKDKLTLSIDDMRVIEWWIDASFAVHPDFKSHTGGCMSMGKGVILSSSRKQRINTKSSTTAELVGVDDMSTMALWTKLFLEAQGFTIDKNILYQDNKSTILLENNGKRSSGQRTRAMNIRYFFITDQIAQGNIMIEYCPTDSMVADFLTKPLQGYKFRKFKAAIMGQPFSDDLDEISDDEGEWKVVPPRRRRKRQECVERGHSTHQGHSARTPKSKTKTHSRK
jgi:hypothetical protein